MDVKGISLSAHHVQQLSLGGQAQLDGKGQVSVRTPDQKPSGFWARFQGSVVPDSGRLPPPSKAAVLNALLAHSGVTATTDGQAAVEFRDKFKTAMLDQDVAYAARLVLSYQDARRAEVAADPGQPVSQPTSSPAMRAWTGPAKSAFDLKGQLQKSGQTEADVKSSMKLLYDAVFPKDAALKVKFMAGKLEDSDISSLAERLIQLSKN